GARRGEALPAPLAVDAERLAEELELDIEPARMVRLLDALTGLFGHVSFELFGHTHGVIEDHDAFFEHRIERRADDVGLWSGRIRLPIGSARDGWGSRGAGRGTRVVLQRPDRGAVPDDARRARPSPRRRGRDDPAGR